MGEEGRRPFEVLVAQGVFDRNHLAATADVVALAYEAEAQFAATRGGDRRHFARAREVGSHPSVAVFGSSAADRQTQGDGDRREEPES